MCGDTRKVGLAVRETSGHQGWLQRVLGPHRGQGRMKGMLMLDPAPAIVQVSVGHMLGLPNPGHSKRRGGRCHLWSRWRHLQERPMPDSKSTKMLAVETSCPTPSMVRKGEDQLPDLDHGACRGRPMASLLFSPPSLPLSLSLLLLVDRWDKRKEELPSPATFLLSLSLSFIICQQMGQGRGGIGNLHE